MAENRVIGHANGLPWHLPADIKRFQLLTTGHSIIMGRKTFDSIGKPLPHRRNIVLTRERGWKKDGVETAHDLPDALARTRGESEVFVVGGADVFRQALPKADRIHLTVVHAKIPGDALFPEFTPAEWRLAEEEPHPADARHAYAFTFRRYERVK
jgi:dihydrofolate reductase